MSESRTDKPDGKRRGWRTACWILIALMALYPLSIGPMWWVQFRIEQDDPQSDGEMLGWYATLYEPLFWLGAHNRTIDNAIRRYIDVLQPVFLSD